KIGVRGDIALVKIKGYIDTTTSSEVSTKLNELINDGTYQLVIDMGGVNYVSSAGWGSFVGEIRNIRENGGDLKIVQMTPDVLEVFEMLEFNRILDYYETIEEAVNDFDISIGLDIAKSMQQRQPEIIPDSVAVSIPSPKTIAKASANKGERKVKSRFSFTKPKLNEATLPLVEKIKILVIQNPNDGARQIKKKLNSQRFGFESVNYFKIRDILKKYNLETKEKRYRFYRSR
ncbi:MAG: STAS domain-containing protein, partial [bacterium]